MVNIKINILRCTVSKISKKIYIYIYQKTKPKFRLLLFRCSFPDLEAEFNANALFLHSAIPALRIALHAQKSKQPLRSSAEDYGNRTDPEDSNATASCGRKLCRMPFSILTTISGSFVHTIVLRGIICRFKIVVRAIILKIIVYDRNRNIQDVQNKAHQNATICLVH